MKKAILSITIVAVCFSCNNRGTGKASESDHAIEDSIKQLSLIKQKDSINIEIVKIWLKSKTHLFKIISTRQKKYVL